MLGEILGFIFTIGFITGGAGLLYLGGQWLDKYDDKGIRK